MKMKKSDLSLREVLEVIFSVANKRAGFFADSYLFKDPSIISKWKIGRALPSNDDIEKIVTFTVNEMTENQHKILRSALEDLIRNSIIDKDITIDNEIKESLLSIEDFKNFLSEVLRIAKTVNRSNKQINDKFSGNLCGISGTDEKEGSDSSGKNIVLDNAVIVSSEDMEGTYSGIVEFNMRLLKKKDRSLKNTESPDIHINRNENYIATDKAGKVKGRITAKSLIGTVIVGIISSLCVIQMVNSLKLTDKVPEVYAVESLAKEFSSLDNLNPKLEVIKQNNYDNSNQKESTVKENNESDVCFSNDNVIEENKGEDEGKNKNIEESKRENESESKEKKEESEKKNKDKNKEENKEEKKEAVSEANQYIKDNTIDNSTVVDVNNGLINSSIVINGDNNNIINGHNIFFNYENKSDSN